MLKAFILTITIIIIVAGTVGYKAVTMVQDHNNTTDAILAQL